MVLSPSSYKIDICLKEVFSLMKLDKKRKLNLSAQRKRGNCQVSHKFSYSHFHLFPASTYLYDHNCYRKSN